jgi:hypothetical protein
MMALAKLYDFKKVENSRLIWWDELGVYRFDDDTQRPIYSTMALPEDINSVSTGIWTG